MEEKTILRKPKSSLLQRTFAVLLAAVLVVGMVSNETAVIVLAQEDTAPSTPDGQQDDAGENTDDIVEKDAEPKEETVTTPEPEITRPEDGTEPNAVVIAAFVPLEEEIKAQTVPVGTALEALSLPGELAVYLAEDDAVEKNEDTDDADAEEKNEDTDDAVEKNEDTDDADAEEKNEDTDDTGEKNGDVGDVKEKNEDAADAEEEDGGEGESGSGNSQESTEQEDSAVESGDNEEEPDAGTDETGFTQETFTVELPEYHAESALTVQTLEKKEPVTIGGVTWKAEPEYDGETEGLYLFTAILPDEYAPAEGVELPDIAVTVKCDVSVMKKAAVMRQAAQTHTHPVCGASCGHSDATHPDVEWTPLTQNSITAKTGTNMHSKECYILDAGNYYLTEDISIDKILEISGEASLCFNGHKITSSLKGTGASDSALQAYKFNTCDCGSGGGFISTGKRLLTGTGYAMLNLYGGNFVGENTVYLNTDTLTLDGAALKATGEAVNIQGLGKAFIKSGSATASGYATVYIQLIQIISL